MSTRRSFLKKSLGTAAGLSVPFILPGGLLAQRPGANDLINLGVIGLGGKGFRGIMGSLLRSFIGYRTRRIVGLYNSCH